MHKKFNLVMKCKEAESEAVEYIYPTSEGVNRATCWCLTYSGLIAVLFLLGGLFYTITDQTKPILCQCMTLQHNQTDLICNLADYIKQFPGPCMGNELRYYCAASKYWYTSMRDCYAWRKPIGFGILMTATALIVTPLVVLCGQVLWNYFVTSLLGLRRHMYVQHSWDAESMV